MAKLRQAGLLEGLVLVGGTAVAYHLGHRISNDLDLFSPDPSFDLDEVRRRAAASLDAETISQSDATLKLRLSDAVVDVVRYPFPSLGRSKTGVEGVKVASLRDLATMKLAAIAKRGVRRDYWDLYEILTRTRLTLRSACRDYVLKFGVSESDLYHVLRALSWFEDAEADPSAPRGLSRQKWREIREWFPQQAARELLRQTKS